MIAAQPLSMLFLNQIQISSGYGGDAKRNAGP
jgi:hypothetical protein